MLETIAFLLVFAASVVKAAANDNGQEFRALCTIYKLASSSKGENAAQKSQHVSQIIAELNNLNISTATDSYFERKDETVPATNGDAKKAELQAWHDKNKQLVAPTTDGKPGEYARPAHTPARDLANKQINNLIQTATQAQTDATKQLETAKTKRNTTHAALETALYAGKKADGSAGIYPSTKAKGCGNGSTGDDEAGTSIMANFLCLCTKDTGSGDNSCLPSGTIPDVADATPQAGAATAWTAIKTNCGPTTPADEPTATKLSQALASFRPLVGNQRVANQPHSPYVLGKHDTGNGCDGKATKTCVNYKNQLTKGHHQIPWVIHVEKAIKELQEAEQIETSIAEAAYQLKALVTQGRNHYLTALHAPKDQPIAIQTKKSPTPEESKACEKYNGNQKECPKDSCTYDEKENKCNPKTGAENKAAGTGEKSTGVDRSKHQTHKTCKTENNDVKRGQKAVCKWIDILDGTGKLPNPECRSSSFFVTKNLL
uniref:Variant surface glycoprotein 1125.343 n=1 Tax=Trypanosoma brucei TaxID=5691 RepID=A0A1J0R5Q7_9TRYP|nr:variant surface glycoprotein 1125.343 [Trypanosoma brucei]